MNIDRVERLCHAVRNAHPDNKWMYEAGQCYNFFLILRSVFPEAEAWYDFVEGHVYTKVGKYWYDVNGKHLRVSDTCEPLEHKRGHRPHRWGKGDTRKLTETAVQVHTPLWMRLKWYFEDTWNETLRRVWRRTHGKLHQ